MNIEGKGHREKVFSSAERNLKKKLLFLNFFGISLCWRPQTLVFNGLVFIEMVCYLGGNNDLLEYQFIEKHVSN